MEPQAIEPQAMELQAMELQAMLLGLAGAALLGLVGSERNDAAAAMAGGRVGAGPAPCRVFGPSYDIQPANEKAPGAPWPAARGVPCPSTCTTTRRWTTAG